MSAIGPKRTSVAAPHMSAFGGKVDMPIALRMSAFEPEHMTRTKVCFLADGRFGKNYALLTQVRTHSFVSTPLATHL
jgi:hypothetical protein